MHTSFTNVTNYSNRFYPTPSENGVFYNHGLSHTEVMVYDVMGNKIKTVQLSSGMLNLNDLSNGMYVAVYHINGFMMKQKLIIAKQGL